MMLCKSFSLGIFLGVLVIEKREGFNIIVTGIWNEAAFKFTNGKDLHVGAPKFQQITFSISHLNDFFLP
jgi:hypothetical protein